MTLSKTDIKILVQDQLKLIQDPIVKSGLDKILVEPTLHLRNWDYDAKGEQFECWTIAIDDSSDTSIIYSEFGHGPKNPWGLVSTSRLWFGMDSGWFDKLEDCFLESFLAADLPIWCIEKEIEYGIRSIIEKDLTCDDAFKIRDDLANVNKKARFRIISRKNNGT